jgi:hypothetical protein
MSMADLTAAAEAMNALTVAYNAKKAAIDNALATAQNGFGALAANLKAVVTDVLDGTITYNPAAIAAVLEDEGAFRTWAELMTYMRAKPVGARITVKLPDLSILTVDAAFGSATYGHRHLVFKPVGAPPVAANRAKILLKCYDKIVFNSWYSLDAGHCGSITIDTVDVAFDTNTNAAIGVSNATFMVDCWPVNHSALSMKTSRATGLASHKLMRAAGAGISSMSVFDVILDGPLVGLARVDGSGVAILGASNVTLMNGAALTSGFTPGVNLISG